MVSHNSTVVVSSPVAPNLPSPGLGPLPAPGAVPAMRQTISKTRLERLFSLGKQRFERETTTSDVDEEEGFDRDAFAVMYCRVLQTATRGNAARNRGMRAQLEAVREENRRLRASLVASAEKETGIGGNAAGKQEAAAHIRKCAADARKDVDQASPAAPHTA